MKDHALAQRPRGQQTKLWQATALAQVQRLRRSRVLHSSAGVTTSSHDAVADQTRGRARSSAKVTRRGR